MPNIVVVYHSGYGHTEFQAKAVAEGAASVAGATVTIVKSADAEQQWDTLNKADAIIFGAPTYMGSLSGDFKKFMDATSKIWFQQLWKDKFAAGFTNSGSLSGDKLNSLIQLVVFAAQHSMHWINLGLLGDQLPNKGAPERINRVGSYLGAMAQSENQEKSPAPGDLETAKLLGKRVAETVAKLKP
jgi:NAD(P)H dehydrogenase (quinone)